MKIGTRVSHKFREDLRGTVIGVGSNAFENTVQVQYDTLPTQHWDGSKSVALPDIHNVMSFVNPSFLRAV